jgi:uncharacterized membrane protein
MFGFLSRFWRTSVIGTFVAGLFFLLPVVLTIFIIIWIVRWIKDALGPGTFLGEVLTQGGKVILGREYEYIAYALGILIALVGIWILGLFIRSQARRSMEGAFDSFMTSVPLFRSVYKPVARIVRMASSEHTADELAAMSVVMCDLGGAGGENLPAGAGVMKSLALLTSPESYIFAGQRRKLVYFPTSPVPMTGYLLFLPEDAVTAVPGMQVAQLMKVYISLGALAPENIPGRFVERVEVLETLKDEMLAGEGGETGGEAEKTAKTESATAPKAANVAPPPAGDASPEPPAPALRAAAPQIKAQNAVPATGQPPAPGPTPAPKRQAAPLKVAIKPAGEDNSDPKG